MARVPNPDIVVKNNLRECINVLQAQRTLESKGRVKWTLKMLMTEIGDYCGISSDGINMVYRGINTPSLGTALKIAEFFGMKVEEIFYLEK